MPTPTDLDLGDNGVNFDLHAKWREERSLMARGRKIQVHILCTRGRIRITGAQVEARGGTQNTLPKV